MSNTKKILNKEILTEKLRFFCRKFSWKKSLTFLFFLILAIIFWGMQVYSQKIDIKISIPVKYTNVEDGILFDNQPPTNISIHIKDYGSAILKYATRSKDSIEIDIGSLIKESTTKRTLQGQNFEQLIRTQLLPSSELVNFTPAYISYAYNRVSVRKLPVLFDGVTHLSVGYQLDGDITIQPDTVIAYGTKASLDTLRFAYTAKDTIANINKNQRIEVLLRSTIGVDYKPNKIYLNVPVDKFIEKEAKVIVECINLPKDLSIKFFPAEIKVVFFVGSKREKLIDHSNFKIIVDYDDIKALTSTSIPIRIIDSPDFVRVKLLEPSEVEFILEQE